MHFGGDRRQVQSSVLDRIDDGVLALDADLRVVYANERAETVLRELADDILGHRLWEAIPATADTVVESAIRTAFDSQEPVTFERYCDPLDQHFDLRAFPDETGVTIYFADVTEQADRQAATEARSAQLEALVANTDAAIFIKDTEGRIEYVNRANADLFGLDPEDAVGRYDRDLFDAETVADIRMIDETIVATGGADIREAERVVDGERRVFLENTYPYRGPDGEIQGVMGISHDITDIAIREADLQRRHDRLDEFASIISHDLVNPLSIAKGRLALLDEEHEDDEHIAAIADALVRIEEMSTDLLTLARQGNVIADTEPVWVTDLVGRCWAMVGASDATLLLDDEFTIHADPDRLRHVFENLFRNAIVHGGHEVTIHVGRLTDGFYVEDDGPGIPEVDRDTVFDPGHKSHTGGTGFGLTIVNRIARAHGWEVRITESSVGGARFEFTDVEVSD